MSRGTAGVLGVAMAAWLAACGERHDASGLVLRVDADAGTLTVSHDPIPEYMDAMVMPLAAAHGDELKDVRPGDRISFRLTVNDGATTIDRVAILSAAPADTGLLLTPAASTLVPIGETIPEFALTDQDGQTLSLRALRGKVVAVSFIYTRCPLPDYCPRVIANLSSLRNRFRSRLGVDLMLLTVTFDPTHDTPGRLKAYAESYKVDVPGWRFLTGPPEEIARVCALFGVESWPEDGLITHTLQTAVIDRDGRLAAAAEGKDFTPRQLGDLVASALGAGR